MAEVLTDAQIAEYNEAFTPFVVKGGDDTHKRRSQRRTWDHAIHWSKPNGGKEKENLELLQLLFNVARSSPPLSRLKD